MKVGRKKIEARYGDVLRSSLARAHKFWNAGDDELHFVCVVRPALQFEQLLETMFALAADGKTNRKGMPSPLRLAVIARRTSTPSGSRWSRTGCSGRRWRPEPRSAGSSGTRRPTRRPGESRLSLRPRRAPTGPRARRLRAGPSSPLREDRQAGLYLCQDQAARREGCARGAGRSRTASRSPPTSAWQSSVSTRSSSLAPSRRPATLRSARAVPPVTYAAFASGGVRSVIRRCASSRAAGRTRLPGRIVEVEPVGQPDGTEVDGALPGRARRRADDELGRTAAEVADGDRLRQSRRGRRGRRSTRAALPPRARGRGRSACAASASAATSSLAFAL